MTKNIFKGNAVAYIYKTNDYNQFKFIETGEQRQAQESDVNRLAEKIKANNLLSINPITVNMRGQIVRGQHRILAAKKLSLDYYYIISDDLPPSEISLEHESSKAWAIKQHARKYMMTENPNQNDYLELQSMFEFYKQKVDFCGLASLLRYNYWYNRDVSKQLKIGKFEVKYKDEAIRFLNSARDLEVLVGENWRKSKFIEMYFKLYHHSSYNHQSFIKKITNKDKQQFMQMPKSTLFDFQTVLNTFYNKYATNNHKIII